MTKGEILSEIRRTAKLNEGRALGMNRFYTETGIRKHDWYGRHWVRWSDALREAGLEPNEWGSALPEDRLLSSLGAFVKELGHFPIDGELKLRSRTDREFPSKDTFRKRFGGTDKLRSALREFAISRGMDEVAALCAARAQSPATTDDEDTGERPEKDELGFVYLIKSGRSYKIGCTNAVGRRERELAIQLPERVRVVHYIKTDDPLGIERYWHGRFEAKRKNGEWFELNSADVAAFRRRKFM